MGILGHTIGRLLVGPAYRHFELVMVRVEKDPASILDKVRQRELARATKRFGRVCRLSHPSGVGFAETVKAWVRIEELAKRAREAADAAHRDIRGADTREESEARRQRARQMDQAYNAVGEVRSLALKAFGHSRAGAVAPAKGDASDEAIEEFGRHRLTALRTTRAANVALWAGVSVQVIAVADALVADADWPELYLICLALLILGGIRAYILNRRLPVRMRWFAIPSQTAFWRLLAYIVCFPVALVLYGIYV